MYRLAAPCLPPATTVTEAVLALHWMVTINIGWGELE